MEVDCGASKWEAAQLFSFMTIFEIAGTKCRCREQVQNAKYIVNSEKCKEHSTKCRVQALSAECLVTKVLHGLPRLLCYTTFSIRVLFKHLFFRLHNKCHFWEPWQIGRGTAHDMSREHAHTGNSDCGSHHGNHHLSSRCIHDFPRYAHQVDRLHQVD